MRTFWKYLLVHAPDDADPSRCLVCNYALTGLTAEDIQRCPECGTQIPRTPDEFAHSIRQYLAPSKLTLVLSVAQLLLTVSTLAVPVLMNLATVAPNRLERVAWLNHTANVARWLALGGIASGVAILVFPKVGRKCLSPYLLLALCLLLELLTPSYIAA